jgi:hypothetical protein
MTAPLNDVRCARLPAAALPVLAELRALPDVRVIQQGEHAWVYWHPQEEAVLRRLLPVRDLELYVERDGLWYRYSQHLPAFTVPEEVTGQPLDRVIFPAPVQPLPPPTAVPRPCTLILVRDDRPRKTTGMLCELIELGRWADHATTAELNALRAARTGRRVLVLGEHLPPLAAGERLWGDRLLVPLGYRPEPGLPETAVAEALGMGTDDMLLLDGQGPQLLTRTILYPLTRAGVRLALREIA